MYRAQTDSPRVTNSQLARLRNPAAEESPARDVLPSPTGTTGTPVLVSATPQSDTPPSSSMGGNRPSATGVMSLIPFGEDSWIAVTPNSDDGQGRIPLGLLPTTLPPDLALAVEGLRIHEHEESFQSEGEDDDEDISIPPSEGSSLESDTNDDDLGESSDDEETILAPRTSASLGHPPSDEALHASLSTLLRSKEPTATDETQSPRRTTAQGPMGMETLSLVTPDELATRTSRSASSRASSSRSCTSSRPGKKSASRSKRAPRSSSKSRSKENGAQVYALWTAAITAGFLVGFGAGYAWKEYLTGRAGEDVRRVGCTWCGDGKR